MSAHTPGPWEALDRKSGEGREWVVHRMGDRVVATVSTHAADARLLAAAPELLRVLTAIANDLSALPSLSDMDQFHLRKARLVIAKATNQPLPPEQK